MDARLRNAAVALVLGLVLGLVSGAGSATAGESYADPLARVIGLEGRIRVHQFDPAATIELLHPRLDGGRLTGTLSGDSAAPTTIDMANVRQLDRRSGSAGQGALIGGTIGLVGGAIGGAAMAGFMEDDSVPTSDRVVGAVIGGFVGGAVFAGIGAAVGAACRHWTPFYPGKRHQEKGSIQHPGRR